MYSKFPEQTVCPSLTDSLTTKAMQGQTCQWMYFHDICIALYSKVWG